MPGAHRPAVGPPLPVLAVVVALSLAAIVPPFSTPGASHAQPGRALRVAYAEEPVAWHPALSELPATADLAALWGLPLFRYDHAGQVRPALATGTRVEPGAEGDAWVVEVDLRGGRWSDGEPVVAADVVATVEALLDEPGGQRLLGPLNGVEAVGDATVRFTFDGPYGRWTDVLAGGWSVLPAHVLDDGGLEAYAGGVPVSGGPFALDSHDPGLRAVFTRHADGPLGDPALDRIEVYFTPSYETALGLIDDRRVDAAFGYLTPNPEARAGRVPEVTAAAPLGGTWTRLRLEPDGRLDGDQRRAVRDAIGVEAFVDGLLGGHGEAMTGAAPGVSGPWSTERGSGAELGGVTVEVLMRGRQAVTGVSGRLLRRDIGLAGADVELLRLDLDEDIDRQPDIAFEVRRDGPRPPLADRVPAEGSGVVRSILEEADASGVVTSREWRDAQLALHEAAWERPLYRVAVAHAWRIELEGVRASSWPGIAFWDVVSWSWGEDGPPEQVPTMGE